MNKFSSSKEPKMVTTNTEEFSFPVMSNPLANFMISSSSSSSSSIWRISSSSSSRVFHHHEEEEEEEEEEDCRMEVRSMCELGSSPGNKREIECASCQGEEMEMEMEERMDYLWEDFNELEDKFDHDHHVRDQAKNANKEIWVFQGLPKLGRTRTRTRRPSSMLVIGKLFKGLLSIRKSAQQKIMKGRV